MPNLTPAQRVAAETARIAGNVADAYTACSAKGATMPAAADQDSDHLAATINTITGGSPAPAPSVEKDVNFYDYDGTLLHSYTKAEAAALNSLPSLPSHTGLVAQEWNYTLAAVKAAAAASYGVNVGVSYDTADGATKLYLKAEAHATFPTLNLHLQLTAQATVTVDWGDGTSTVLTNSGSTDADQEAVHNYQEFTQASLVCISISGDDFRLGWSSANANIFNNTKILLAKVNIGSNCIGINRNALSNCRSLTSITIPNSVINITHGAFSSCFSFTSIIFPNGSSLIGNNAFYNCYSLTLISIPNSVTAIGNYAFQYCYSLESIIIPDSVRSIGNYAFQLCYSLTSITIPNGVALIKDTVCDHCVSVTLISIPQSVTSIENNAFQYCDNLQIVDLSGYTDPARIPTVKASSFGSTTCKYLVANATMLAAFRAATNWSSISSDRWEALS